MPFFKIKRDSHEAVPVVVITEAFSPDPRRVMLPVLQDFQCGFPNPEVVDLAGAVQRNGRHVFNILRHCKLGHAFGPEALPDIGFGH